MHMTVRNALLLIMFRTASLLCIMIVKGLPPTDPKCCNTYGLFIYLFVCFVNNAKEDVASSKLNYEDVEMLLSGEARTPMLMNVPDEWVASFLCNKEKPRENECEPFEVL
jgi:hypothetical protein